LQVRSRSDGTEPLWLNRDINKPQTEFGTVAQSAELERVVILDAQFLMQNELVYKVLQAAYLWDPMEDKAQRVTLDRRRARSIQQQFHRIYIHPDPRDPRVVERQVSQSADRVAQLQIVLPKVIEIL
jgi:hypothetical protein